ncbi:hypothetical protein G6F60_006593 [Rhizopus arrhizus]|nr:hypothetical protein G6F60_006593 [Rhizopus arrhizus]
MLSVLIFFGLLSAFMLVSSLPLGPATLEKRLPDGIGGSLDSIPNIEIGLASRLVLTLFLHSAAANQASFLVQNVENLSDIPSESVDAYTIAFGIRTRIHVESIRKFCPQEKIA